MNQRRSVIAAVSRRIGALFLLVSGAWAWSQDLPGRQDDTIPAQAELVYEKGLQFLAKTQNEKGAWNDSVGSEAGVVGLCVASFLAHGEDPVNGPYAKNIRTGIDYILTQQNEKNGYIGSSMYNHAFATKALAESYGVVDNPKIAPALKKAVEMILSSQKRNRFGAWRYTPDSRDADTTVTGCQMVTLFARRVATLLEPCRNHSSSWMIERRCSFLVVTSGKPALRSKRIWWPNTERVPVPVRSVFSTPCS
jgi:squalene cyclase